MENALRHLVWRREATSVGQFGEEGGLFLGGGPCGRMWALRGVPGDLWSHSGVFRPPQGQEPHGVLGRVDFLPHGPPPLEGCSTEPTSGTWSRTSLCLPTASVSTVPAAQVYVEVGRGYTIETKEADGVFDAGLGWVRQGLVSILPYAHRARVGGFSDSDSPGRVPERAIQMGPRCRGGQIHLHMLSAVGQIG